MQSACRRQHRVMLAAAKFSRSRNVTNACREAQLFKHPGHSHGVACSPESRISQRSTSICAQEGNSASAGSVLGAAGLITGSTVGAGILALPTVTQHAGFGPSATMLVASWAVLQLQAMLIAEVNLRCHQQHQDAQPQRSRDRVITLTEMSNMTLGAPAEAAVSSIYLLMTFTLLLAYIARAGDLLGPGLHMPVAAGVTGFTAGLAGLQALGGSAGAARTTSALTAGMIVAFTAVVVQGAGNVDWAHSLQHADWGSAGQCLPIMFLSLVYHDLIPVVCQLLGWERCKIVPALLLGSLTPLGMFLAWEAVCLGQVPYSPGVSIDPVDFLIHQQGGFSSAAIALFSIAALTTSAIGVSLSVSNTMKRLLKTFTPLSGTTSPLQLLPQRSRRAQHRSQKGDAQSPIQAPSVRDCVAILLTLAPPAIASMGDSNIFLTATHFAGAYGSTLLYGVLPPIMAWAARAQQQDQDEQSGTEQQPPSGRLLAGGRPVLLGLAGTGLLVEGLQLVLDVPALKPQAVATTVQPVFEVASASLTSVSLSAAQLAASVQQPLTQVNLL